MTAANTTTDDEPLLTDEEIQTLDMLVELAFAVAEEQYRRLQEIHQRSDKIAPCDQNSYIGNAKHLPICPTKTLSA